MRSRGGFFKASRLAFLSHLLGLSRRRLATPTPLLLPLLVAIRPTSTQPLYMLSVQQRHTARYALPHKRHRCNAPPLRLCAALLLKSMRSWWRIRSTVYFWELFLTMLRAVQIPILNDLTTLSATFDGFIDEILKGDMKLHSIRNYKYVFYKVCNEENYAGLKVYQWYLQF